MENKELTSKEKFLEWICKEYQKLQENKIQRGMFLGLLINALDAVLQMIKLEISSKVLQYENETGDHDFHPGNLDELSNEVLISLVKYFLPEKRA